MLKSAVYRAEVLLSRDGRTCIIIALLLSLFARFLRDCTLLYMILRGGVIICDIRHKIQCKVSRNATNPASNDSTTILINLVYMLCSLNAILLANLLYNFCFYCYCA